MVPCNGPLCLMITSHWLPLQDQHEDIREWVRLVEPAASMHVLEGTNAHSPVLDMTMLKC